MNGILPVRSIFLATYIICAPAFADSISTVSSMAALRSTSATTNPVVYLTQYSATTGMGGGEFTYNGQSSCADDGGTLIQASGGCYSRNTGAQPYSPAWFGAQCGGVQIKDGVSNNGSATIISGSGKFTAGMAGWIAVVNRAATGNKQLVSTVVSVPSSSTITLAASAGASNTGETISLYPDDTTAFIETASAAASANVGIIMPASSICGLNGATKDDFVITSSLYLNGSTIWLGQVGSDSTTGTRVNFDGIALQNPAIIGPGTIDGLYQTDQAVAQDALFGVGFLNGPFNPTIQNITIQNTKGRCLDAETGTNATINNLTVKNCGDFQYIPSSGDPQVGRSNGVEFNSFAGNISIDAFRCYSAAQSCLLIEGYAAPSNVGHFAVSNSYATGSGYYNYDFEQLNGTVHLVNDQSFNVGNTPVNSSIAYNGLIFRDVAYMDIANYSSLGTVGNALVGFADEDPTSNTQEISLKSINLQGSSTNHKAQLYLAFGWLSATQHLTISLDSVRYDTAYFLPLASPSCSTASPMQQLLYLHNVYANQAATQTPADTNIQPQANSNQMLYMLADNSFLGTVQISSSATNNKAVYFDWSKVYTNGSISFSGGTSSIAPSAIAGLPGANSPGNNSFICP